MRMKMKEAPQIAASATRRARAAGRTASPRADARRTLAIEPRALPRGAEAIAAGRPVGRHDAMAGDRERDRVRRARARDRARAVRHADLAREGAVADRLARCGGLERPPHALLERGAGQ